LSTRRSDLGKRGVDPEMHQPNIAVQHVDEPWPHRGLSYRDFIRIGENGLGDPYNAYPHSMEVYNGRLYVGTSRANLCMLKVSKIRTALRHWPVECPEKLYDLDMRAQIHTFEFETGRWHEVFRSPMIDGTDGTQVPREMSYRCMTTFQGDSDDRPTLYCGTYASVKGQGAQILRSTDGEEFRPVPRPEGFGDVITTLRLLIPFKGRLFTSPTGRAGGNPNAAFQTIVYETRDPSGQPWVAVSEPSFGDPGNVSVFEMLPFGDYLYAGTANFEGFQVWRTKAEGEPPYAWECVISKGAWRGRENQCPGCLCVFKGALYVGTGIQHGGIDIANKVGPAGPELIRIREDGSWDLIVGRARDTPHGRKEPLSGFAPGFGFITNGYFWRMDVHDGWIYIGTFNWAIMMNYSSQDKWPELMRRVYGQIGPQEIFHNFSGAQLYRSCDGENWLTVTTNGFDNPYNYGIRGLISTPHGLAVGLVNPFAPRVGIVEGDSVHYEDNPRGGLEIWLGRTERDRPIPEAADLG
jgi:hypothetical protein